MSAAGARRWTVAEIPDLSGRTAVVTGASAGIGLETARVLGGHGASVVLACRNIEKAERAAARIRAENEGVAIDVVHLDLASLASVHNAAGAIRSAYPRLDRLINNAGVMELMTLGEVPQSCSAKFPI